MTELAILGAILGGFVVILGIVFFTGKRAGSDSVKSDSYRETVSILRREQDAAATAPQSKEAVIDRLRNGGGL